MMRFRNVSYLMALAMLVCCGTACPQPSADAPWKLAVRVMSYGKFQESAYAHMRSIGLKYVFIAAPMPADVDKTMAELKTYGLTPLVCRGNADLSKDTFVSELTPQLEACAKMGVNYCFLSAKRGETPLETAYARLRAAGDVAKAHGVTITLETHPDMGTNGDIQVATMKAIDHPNIKVNFDTGNITYYNHDTTALAELKKSIEYVRTVEFKDHSAEFETWNFPVLGTGKVDFPEIVKLLRAHHYAGPVTIEFEGVKGVELTEEQLKQAIADSVAYVRSLGGFE